MIRRLIILLLIVGGFAQDELIFINGTSVKGQYVSTENDIIYFIPEDGTVKQSIHKDKVRELILKEEETKIESSKDVESIIQNTQKPLVGGIFIAIGGGLLFSNIDKECLDCIYGESRYEEYVKDLESTQKIGYGFIILGGILLGLGI